MQTDSDPHCQVQSCHCLATLTILLPRCFQVSRQVQELRCEDYRGSRAEHLGQCGHRQHRGQGCMTPLRTLQDGEQKTVQQGIGDLT
jgi:hypothetical protein